MGRRAGRGCRVPEGLGRPPAAVFAGWLAATAGLRLALASERNRPILFLVTVAPVGAVVAALVAGPGNPNPPARPFYQGLSDLKVGGALLVWIGSAAADRGRGRRL